MGKHCFFSLKAFPILFCLLWALHLGAASWFSEDSEDNVEEHERDEHLGEVGALAAGAFAVYEAHEVKVDPEHAERHRIEEDIAGVVAVGEAGYALYEHHEVKKDERVQEDYVYTEEGTYGNDPYEKNEHRGVLGALAAEAFAMYEGHEAEVDPEHARRHKVEEEVAEAAALGAGGYALYEHHEEKKHHGFFG